MISQACETAVTRALKIHDSVVNKKKRRVTFHAKEGDHTLDENGIREQVEQLQLYRENKAQGKDSESSSSESES